MGETKTPCKADECVADIHELVSSGIIYRRDYQWSSKFSAFFFDQRTNKNPSLEHCDIHREKKEIWKLICGKEHTRCRIGYKKCIWGLDSVLQMKAMKGEHWLAMVFQNWYNGNGNTFLHKKVNCIKLWLSSHILSSEMAFTTCIF